MIVMYISGTGDVSISILQNNRSLSSRLSGVNMWNYEVSADQVYRLSLGCGDEAGNLLRWSDLKSSAKRTGHVLKLPGPSCTYHDGELNGCFIIMHSFLKSK